MDYHLLEPEELKIEYEIRNIRGLQSVQQSMLKLYLEKEARGEEPTPSTAHPSALKNPKRELSHCASKIMEIKNSLIGSFKEDAGHKALVLDEMITRAHHYHSRIIRISAQPCVIELFPSVLALCEELSSLLKEAADEKVDLNESIANLEKLDISHAKEIVNAIEVDENLVSASNKTTFDSLVSAPTSDKIVNQLHRLISSGHFKVSPEMAREVRDWLPNLPIADSTPAMVSLSPIVTDNSSSASALKVSENRDVVDDLISMMNGFDRTCYIPAVFDSTTMVSNSLRNKLPGSQDNRELSQPRREESANVKIMNNDPNILENKFGHSSKPNTFSNTVVRNSVQPNLKGQPKPTIVEGNYADEMVPNQTNINELQLLLTKLRSLMNNPTNPEYQNKNDNVPPNPTPRNHSIPVASSPNHEFVRSPYHLPVQNPLHASVVHKWNLVFDGSKDGLNVERFLYRVESNASAYGIPEFKLLNDIQYLLKGKAINWYWAHKELNRPTTWAEFREAMIRHFQGDLDDFDILQCIKDRKQKLNESFQDFHSCISEMTLALSKPLSDQEFLHYLQGNMRKGLKQKLAGRRFKSSTELFDECTHIEHAWRQIPFIPEQLMDLVDCFQKSSTHSKPSQRSFQNSREVHELTHDLGPETKQPHYLETDRGSTLSSLPHDPTIDYSPSNPEVCAIGQFPQFKNQSPDTSKLLFPQALFSKVKCWNCGDLGHFYYRCSKELTHVFCRGCGQPDILYEYCVKCQENCRRGMRTGVQVPPNPNKTSSQFPKSQLHPHPSQPLVEEVATNTDPEFYRLLKSQK